MASLGPKPVASIQQVAPNSLAAVEGGEGGGRLPPPGQIPSLHAPHRKPNHPCLFPLQLHGQGYFLLLLAVCGPRHCWWYGMLVAGRSALLVMKYYPAAPATISPPSVFTKIFTKSFHQTWDSHILSIPTTPNLPNKSLYKDS